MAVSKLDVQKLYVAYFNRPADLAGLDYWTKSGATVAQIATSFSNVQEYKDAFAGMSNTEVVAQVYENLFARTADFDGLNYWVKLLNDKKITIADVVTTVYNGAVGSDKDILTNKVAAADLFTTAINTTEEAVAYSTAAANSAGRAYLNLVTADAATVTTAAATADAVLAKIISDALPPVVVPPPVPPTITTFTLTTGLDNVTGSALADTFNATIVNNSNTFQSGDSLVGGAGNDTLNAVVGNSANFAILATTSGIENVIVQAQAVAVDSNQNNIYAHNPSTVNGGSTIDAQNMVGVNLWETSNSRANVVIEDVRILNSQVTKDITLEMYNTDPASVNSGSGARSNAGFEVYFDPESLRAAPNTASGSSLSINVLDLKAVGSTPATPLLNSPYNGFTFKLDGVVKSISSTAIDNATNYADLLTAVKAALTTAKAADASLAGFTAALSGNFTAKDGDTGVSYTGQTIVLTNSGKGVITSDATTGFTTATGVVPSNSNLYTNIQGTAPVTNNNLITANIVLDNVGRSDEAGNLVVGSMATRNGVERFEILATDSEAIAQGRTTGVNGTNQSGGVNGTATVDGGLTGTLYSLNGNWISSASSTNNILQEVQLVNAAGSVADLNIGTGIDQANNNITTLRTPSNLVNPDGLKDVRLVDGSTFAGDLRIGATVTSASIQKYISLVDTQSQGAAAADNIKLDYKLGTANDTLNLVVDGAVLASNSKIIAGREDFALNVNGGAGNDLIQVKIANALTGGTDAWYNNQVLNNNVTVSGGDGDDTIRTLGAGDANINGDSGADTIYTDNTGASKAQFVFNTPDQVTAGATVRNIDDLRSDTNEVYKMFNTKLVVSFKGVPTTALTVASTNYKTSDLQINQAIKEAINNDATLNKLLIAEDGPSNSLVITSKIDGTISTGDLTISLTAPTTATPAEIAGAGLAYGLTTTVTPTLADMLVVTNAAKAAFDLNGDYATAYTNDGSANISGTASISTSDNIITGGAGNDVIVLGTTVGTSNATSSNEVLKFAPGFGSDVVVNFSNTGFGVDHLDFSGLGGVLNATSSNFNEAVIGTSDKSITVVASSTATESSIAALYNVDSIIARTHVYVAVGTDNVANVYQVADGAGLAAGNVVVTKAGSIDLATTAFTSLTAANFVNLAAAGANSDYLLAYGIDGNLPSVGGGGGAAPVAASTVTVTAANTTANDATVGNVTYNIAPTSTFTYSINGFAAGDHLAFTAGSTISVVNTSGTDGNVTVTGSLNSQTVTIQLTGVATVSDGAIFGQGSFNTAFGATDSLV